MSTLTLVRHGQATPFQAVTDQLSPVGEEQSRRLGGYWVRHQILFDEVYSGPLIRQQRTAELVGESYAAAGLAWPGVQVLEEFKEYDADGILNLLVPALAGRDAQFGELVEAYRQAGHLERNRHFQKMFEVVIGQWLREEITAVGVEPWPTFRERVRRGIKRVTSGGGGGRRVAVFTSGGPIGAAVQLALDAPDGSALEVNWRVRNCSLTEFIFSRDRFSLDSFNAVPHLDEPPLWTFR